MIELKYEFPVEEQVGRDEYRKSKIEYSFLVDSEMIKRYLMTFSDYELVDIFNQCESRENGWIPEEIIDDWEDDDGDFAVDAVEEFIDKITVKHDWSNKPISIEEDMKDYFYDEAAEEFVYEF